MQQQIKLVWPYCSLGAPTPSNLSSPEQTITSRIVDNDEMITNLTVYGNLQYSDRGGWNRKKSHVITARMYRILSIFLVC